MLDGDAIDADETPTSLDLFEDCTLDAKIIVFNAVKKRGGRV